MTNVTTTPASVPVMIAAPAKELAKKVHKLLTLNMSCVLGCTAAVAVLLYQATGEHPILMTVLALAWVLQLAAMLAIDIRQKGGEL